jgi:hypothetical protein
MNLTGQAPYQRGTKQRKAKKNRAPSGTGLDDLIESARTRAPERDYLDWLRTQPSALSGGYSWNEGQPFCEPAHWRTAKHAGTSQKPEFLAIPSPMTSTPSSTGRARASSATAISGICNAQHTCSNGLILDPFPT